MSGISVFVTVGIGAWTAHAEVMLIACPHVGDRIEVRGRSVFCEHVTIGATKVTVSETRRFVSEDQAKDFWDTDA